jgi:hypothetical protein
MSLAGLLAFAGGAGFEPLSALMAFVALLVALAWQPTPRLSARLERVWLPLAVLLVARALFHVVAVGGDVVVPVVDLLLLLMCAEALRSLDAPNDARLYALSFALLLASTAYRPGILFGVAFVAYVSLGTLALLVGHVRRKAEHYRVGYLELDRPFLLTTVALSGVTLLISVAVFVSFPRVSRAWAGRGDVLASSIAGFSDEVSLGEFGATILPNPQIVLRVEFPDGAPRSLGGLHWRGRSYDRFDGVRWSRSRGIRPSSGMTTFYEAWSDSIIRQQIYGASLDVRVLFALHPVLDIEAQTQIYPLFDNVGDHVYWGRAAPAYMAHSVGELPAPDDLRQAERGFVPDGRRYLQVPELPERIQALADSLTRGATTRYDRTVAIESWLRSEFTYTLDLPRTSREATLEHFLFERRAGHCEYFSTAMVVLLRSVGIHSRNVNGFLGGQWSDFGNYLAVTQNEAHSWVEVWFPNRGWVTFDPTPPGSVSTSASSAWFWPGRFLFDAIQHRWGKWVLDYSVDSQIGLFDRLMGGIREVSTRTDPSGDDARGSSLLWLAGVLVMGGAGAWLALRHRAATRPESRLYLTLLDACRRAGMAPRDEEVTPLALVRALRDVAHPAAAPAELLVDHYVRARFAGEGLSRNASEEMAKALRLARHLLRKQPVPAARVAGQ